MDKIITELPEDNFGLFVENEKDERTILWVVNEIGETKLRTSASKRSKYAPERPLFISTIIKRLHLKVPRSIYAEVSVQIFRVYVLVTRQKDKIKIGMTGRWPDRAFDFLKTANYTLNFEDKVREFFDLELSFAFDCTIESDAREIESSIKLKFNSFNVNPPVEIGFGNRCSTEWFSFHIYDELLIHVAGCPRIYSLKESLIWNRYWQD